MTFRGQYKLNKLGLKACSSSVVAGYRSSCSLQTVRHWWSRGGAKTDNIVICVALPSVREGAQYNEHMGRSAFAVAEVLS